MTYVPLYPGKIITPQIDFTQADNYIFKEFDEVLSSRLGDKRIIRHPEIFFTTMNDILVNNESGHFLSVETKSLFAESSVWKDIFISQHSFYNSLKIHSAECIRETATFMYSPNNYFHWFGEFLCRVFVAWEIHPGLNIYINTELNKWQKEALIFFNVDRQYIHTVSSAFKFSKFNKFIFISFLGNPEIIHADVLKKINQFILNKFKQQEGIIQSNRKARIYISRLKARHRKVINEPELIHLLEKFRFTTLYLEDYPVEEQYKLFYEAESIVAVHGPSLTKVVACNKNTVIVELFNEKHIVEAFAQISFSLSLNYYAFKAESVGEAKPRKDKTMFYGFNDIKIDLHRLESLLQAIL